MTDKGGSDAVNHGDDKNGSKEQDERHDAVQ